MGAASHPNVAAPVVFVVAVLTPATTEAEL